MKTIAKLYKEYGGFFGIFAIFSWLALIISSTWLILHINSAKADTKISPDCIYYDEEKSRARTDNEICRKIIIDLL